MERKKRKINLIHKINNLKLGNSFKRIKNSRKKKRKKNI